MPQQMFKQIASETDFVSTFRNRYAHRSEMLVSMNHPLHPLARRVESE